MVGQGVVKTMGWDGEGAVPARVSGPRLEGRPVG